MEILGIVRILELNNLFDRLNSRPDTAEKNQGRQSIEIIRIEIQRGKKKNRKEGRTVPTNKCNCFVTGGSEGEKRERMGQKK